MEARKKNRSDENKGEREGDAQGQAADSQPDVE